MWIAEKASPVRKLSAVLAHSGDSWFWLIGLTILWWLGSDYWKDRAVVLIVAILITAGIVFLVKQAIRRRRPEGEWGKLYRATDPHSFPSGHAVRAVMLAVIALGLGPLWLGLILAVWAPMVGLARITMRLHYLSDVLVGMLLGLIIGGVVLLVL